MQLNLAQFHVIFALDISRILFTLARPFPHRHLPIKWAFGYSFGNCLRVGGGISSSTWSRSTWSPDICWATGNIVICSHYRSRTHTHTHWSSHNTWRWTLTVLVTHLVRLFTVIQDASHKPTANLTADTPWHSGCLYPIFPAPFWGRQLLRYKHQYEYLRAKYMQVVLLNCA